MRKKLTIALDWDVYERLCRVVGDTDEERCREFILQLVEGRVCSPFTNLEAEQPYRQPPEDSEAAARAYLKTLYQSGDLDLARKSSDPPQWVELAYQAMLAGDAWDGSAAAILELGGRERAEHEHREARALALLEAVYYAKSRDEAKSGDALAWVEGLAADLGVDENDAW